MGWDGLNRRKFPRAKYPCLVTIRHGAKNPDVVLTHTENIGTGGVCLILKKSLKLFSPVEIEIDLLDTAEHLKCRGRVVWCVQRRSSEKKKPSFYDTGVEFSDMSEKDQKRIDAIIKSVLRYGKKSPYM